MKNISSLFIKKSFVFLLTLLCIISVSSFKILDPNVESKFFERIEYDLDDLDIDIIQNWESSVSTQGRPTLAPIANYQASIDSKETAWTKAFADLYANAVVALEVEYSVTAGSFIENWEKTPVEKRIFISFTKDDIKHAEDIKNVLEKKGYKVFIYAESGREMFTSPEMIVRCMKSAGEVLILDTENSRQKVGVLAEALSFAKYSYKSELELVNENELIKKRMQSVMSDFDKKVGDALSNKIKVYYRKKYGKNITNYEAKKIANRSYKSPYNATVTPLEYNYSSTQIPEIYSKDPYSSNYAYNQKLKNEQMYLLNIANISSGNIAEILSQAPTEKVLKFGLNYLGICPYYKIPIILCPFCSPRMLLRR